MDHNILQKGFYGGLIGLCLWLVLSVINWQRRRSKFPPSPPASWIPGIGHALLLADSSSVLSTKLGRWADQLGVRLLNSAGRFHLTLNAAHLFIECTRRDYDYLELLQGRERDKSLQHE